MHAEDYMRVPDDKLRADKPHKEKLIQAFDNCQAAYEEHQAAVEAERQARVTESSALRRYEEAKKVWNDLVAFTAFTKKK